ncbi:hypothetical protein [Barnesiella intestinihominis]|uniref:hypothetical protein n=1 Tax=Barnesiella intestinihominis TaxID=487174 RepID=UPI003A8A6428
MDRVVASIQCKGNQKFRQSLVPERLFGRGNGRWYEILASCRLVLPLVCHLSRLHTASLPAELSGSF